MAKIQCEGLVLCFIRDWLGLARKGFRLLYELVGELEGGIGLKDEIEVGILVQFEVLVMVGIFFQAFISYILIVEHLN